MAQRPEHPTVKHFYEQRCHNSPRHIIGFVGASGDRRSTGSCSWRPPRTKALISFGEDQVGLKQRRRRRFPHGGGRWGQEMGVISPKVAAGLGQMGIHRNVIHPRFGNFILLGTVLVDAEVSEHSHPTVYNSCLECKLCVAACPTGAMSPASSISLPATRTTTVRSWVDSATGWKRLPTAAVPTRTGRKSTLGDGFHVARFVVWRPLQGGVLYGGLP